jgi:DNA-directed RNA polymerase sigma subunit (sigma70/sigma32)
MNEPMAGLAQAELERILETLDLDEQSVMRARFVGDGAPRTVEEAAQLLQMTPEDVVRIEGEALNKIAPPDADSP